MNPEKVEPYLQRTNAAVPINTRATFCAHEKYWNTGMSSIGKAEALYQLQSLIPPDGWFCRTEEESSIQYEEHMP